MAKVQQKTKIIEVFSTDEAIKKAKESSKVKFDATVEIHFNFNLDITKADQMVRTTVVLPNGTGKRVKVAVFASKKVEEADVELTEDDLAKIQNGTIKPGVDFDYIVSEPRYMPKLAVVARILGPAGVMPNPKNGTVSENPAEAVKKLKKGQVEIKNEQNQAVAHTVIGKVSFTEAQLKENFLAILEALKAAKPQKAKGGWVKSCFITTSMGPSFGVDITEFFK
jgi:large subunit ribosomal protein L1